jgi:uncharacterized protein
MGRIYSLKAGSRVPEDILKVAEESGTETATVEAIGGVEELKVAYFNRVAKKYEEHSFGEFLEVLSLLGNITMKDGKPFLHVHGTFGRRDLSVIGGHVISAKTFPILEVVVSPTENRALRRFDEDIGLNLIYRTEQSAQG